MTAIELAESVEKLQVTLRALVRVLEPRTPDEWELHEKLTAANRIVRKIDTGALRQASLL